MGGCDNLGLLKATAKQIILKESLHTPSRVSMIVTLKSLIMINVFPLCYEVEKRLVHASKHVQVFFSFLQKIDTLKCKIAELGFSYKMKFSFG